MQGLYDKVSYRTSKMVTNMYSTSFSMGVRLLHRSIREAIYNIYGFVRLADEIVDTFHDHPKEKLLNDFEASYYQAMDEGISLNPILNAFQQTVIKYNIEDDLVQAFLKSMRNDLHKQAYTAEEYKDYIYGSADAVGLMCLKVFVNGDTIKYDELKPYAMRLGSAFQKVNFLRDLKSDLQNLHRIYFPALQDKPLDDTIKKEIIKEINEDFEQALTGIRKLPNTSRLGVYTAYYYYRNLLYKLEKLPARRILSQRIRISNARKIWLTAFSCISCELKLI